MAEMPRQGRHLKGPVQIPDPSAPAGAPAGDNRVRQVPDPGAHHAASVQPRPAASARSHAAVPPQSRAATSGQPHVQPQSQAPAQPSPLPRMHATAPASGASNPYASTSSSSSRKPHRSRKSREGTLATTAVSRFDSPMSSGAYAGTGYIGQDRRASGRGGKGGRGGNGASAKPRRKGSFLSTLLIVVGVVLLLVAGGMFGYAQLQYHAQDQVNQQLAAYATVSDDPAATVGPQVDWAGLKSVNPDVVGWIQIPGTVVNYPVYQADDNEKYLHTTATGEYSIGGQIFMDYENTAPGMQEPQTVIYGHHLYNGAMFTTVDDLADQAKFDETSTVWYVTEDTTYELEPLFFYRTPATNGDARRTSFTSTDDFHTYLSGLLAQASTKSSSADAAVPKVTKVLTLATCDYDNNFGQGNGRGLVVCALKSEVQSATGSGSGA